MKFLRGVFFFGLVNILVMVSVSIVAALVNILLYGQAFPETNNYIVQLAIMSVMWGSIGAFISLMMSKWMAKRMMGLKMIDPRTASGEARDIVEIVHRMARAAQLPAMPEVAIFDSPEVNAFATGPSKSNSLVAVSTGLLRTMDREQVEGVIGHEVAHIANGDMVTLTLVQGVVNSFVIFFSRLLASVIAGSSDDRRSSGGMEFMMVMVLQVVFGLLGNMVVCYVSRAREFRADAGGARFAGRDKMTSALRALQAQVKRHTAQAPDDQFATFKISHERRGLMHLFRTHPTLEARIARLQTSY